MPFSPSPSPSFSSYSFSFFSSPSHFYFLSLFRCFSLFLFFFLSLYHLTFPFLSFPSLDLPLPLPLPLSLSLFFSPLRLSHLSFINIYFTTHVTHPFTLQFLLSTPSLFLFLLFIHPHPFHHPSSSRLLSFFFSSHSFILSSFIPWSFIAFASLSDTSLLSPGLTLKPSSPSLAGGRYVNVR